MGLFRSAADAADDRALKTSASSGIISSRSASVFDDANCSSGPSLPVLGRRY